MRTMSYLLKMNDDTTDLFGWHSVGFVTTRAKVLAVIHAITLIQKGDVHWEAHIPALQTNGEVVK